MKRSGFADLPLHYGRVPRWLADRMAAMGTCIVEAVLLRYGRAQLLARLADPCWFQALGTVMGMDWHSSGITTSVMGALRRGIGSRADELGIHICGGRGNHARNTPAELRAIAERRSLDGEELVRTSRLTARVDNNAIGDGFQIYLHSFILSADGEWAVVQQGMNTNSRMARRYHWHSASVGDFTSRPHTGITGDPQGLIMNLVDPGAQKARSAMLAITRDPPDQTLRDIHQLHMPARRDVRPADVDLKRLGAVLAVAYERSLRDFASLLLVENLGPRTLQSLALVAEVVHGAPTRFTDPARYSFAHGGKDGHPFPVPLKVFDESISFMKTALDSARMGDTEKLEGFRRLERFTRMVEAHGAPGADFNAAIAHEKAISHACGGRSVCGNRERRPAAGKEQLPLFR